VPCAFIVTLCNYVLIIVCLYNLHVFYIPGLLNMLCIILHVKLYDGAGTVIWYQGLVPLIPDHLSACWDGEVLGNFTISLRFHHKNNQPMIPHPNTYSIIQFTCIIMHNKLTIQERKISQRFYKYSTINTSMHNVTTSNNK
jgi:hypothetical protein